MDALHKCSCIFALYFKTGLFLRLVQEVNARSAAVGSLYARSEGDTGDTACSVMNSCDTHTRRQRPGLSPRRQCLSSARVAGTTHQGQSTFLLRWDFLGFKKKKKKILVKPCSLLCTSVLSFLLFLLTRRVVLSLAELSNRSHPLPGYTGRCVAARAR